MSLLIYVPGVQGADPEHVTRAGLPGLIGPNAPSLVPREVLAGPDNGRGMLYTWRADPVAYQPDEQEWFAAPGGAYWLGRWKGRPIAPADLARPKQYAGPLVELRDGQAWQIPVAFQLVQILGEWTPGEMELRPTEEFRAYWDQAGEWVALFERMARDPAARHTFQFQAAWTFACRGLAINYLLTPAIVTWLELIDTALLQPIIQAAIETEAWRETKTVL